MKYPIGTKVRVVSLQEGKYRGDCDVQKGEVGKIVKYIKDCHNQYCVKFKGQGWFFPEHCLEAIEEVEDTEQSTDKKDISPITSDGGSSDYYFTKLPKHMIDQIVETGGIEIKDIARYVYDLNADAFNIIKAQKRIIEAKKGKGKAGIDSLYDANKIRFFAEEQYKAIKEEGTL